MSRLRVACLTCALVAAALALTAVVGASENIADDGGDDALLRARFADFTRRFDRSYANDAERESRFAVFRDNMAHAAAMQQRDPTATYGVNVFADLTPEEFASRLNYKRSPAGSSKLLNASLPAAVADFDKSRGLRDRGIPENFDWRAPDNGRPACITGVKNQGQCGSCWAFSATETLESAWILAGHPAVNLAPQQTVDCDMQDNGCNGGNPPVAYEYMYHAGVEAELSYPYEGVRGACRYNPNAVVAKLYEYYWGCAPCQGGSCVGQNEQLLAENLYGASPMSVCLDASVWQYYTGGILSPASGCSGAANAMDHCVQLVGYGNDAGTLFWQVRNSWGTGWGEAGYIRLLWGENTCGVADEATYVTTAP